MIAPHSSRNLRHPAIAADISLGDRKKVAVNVGHDDKQAWAEQKRKFRGSCGCL